MASYQNINNSIYVIKTSTNNTSNSNLPTKSTPSSSNHHTRTKGFMTVQEYKRLLNRHLYNLLISNDESKKYFFITLTLTDSMDYTVLIKEFTRFHTCITRYGKRRKWGKMEYVRAIELQDNGKYHIHIIAFFENPECSLSSSQVETMWKRGFCKVESVYDLVGLKKYITTFCNNVINSYEKSLTLFPKGARPISSSRNFEAQNEVVEEREIHANEVKELLHDIIERNQDNPDFRIETIGHQYYDENAQDYRYHVDKYIIFEGNIESTLDSDLLSSSL